MPDPVRFKLLTPDATDPALIIAYANTCNVETIRSDRMQSCKRSYIVYTNFHNHWTVHKILVK